MAKRVRQTRSGAAYQVVKPEQLKTLVSPLRGSIYSTVTAFGPMSVREVAEILGVAPTSLYFHFEQLFKVGLIVETGMRPTIKKPEQLYDVPSRRMRMTDALRDPRNARYLKAIVASICKQANRDFARADDAPHLRNSGASRNLRFARLIGRPDAATLAKINAHLDAIAELLAETASGAGGIVSLNWVLAPQGRRSGD